jgi:hypothetical protein
MIARLLINSAFLTVMYEKRFFQRSLFEIVVIRRGQNKLECLPKKKILYFHICLGGVGTSWASLSNMTLSTMTNSTTTLSIMTLGRSTSSITILKLDTQHNKIVLSSCVLFMLSIDMLNVVVMLSVHMLIVIMLIVDMMNVDMLMVNMLIVIMLMVDMPIVLMLIVDKLSVIMLSVMASP